MPTRKRRDLYAERGVTRTYPEYSTELPEVPGRNCMRDRMPDGVPCDLQFGMSWVRMSACPSPVWPCIRHTTTGS
jgi:hypothetical protein